MEQLPDDPFSPGPSDKPSIKIPQQIGSNSRRFPNAFKDYHGSSDASLFSSSLPVLPHPKLKFSEIEHGVQSMDDTSSKLNVLGTNVESKDSIEDLDLQHLGFYLPNDEDELLSGIMDDFDPSELPRQMEELDESDLFDSGGGMELDSDPTESLSIGLARTNISNGYGGNGSGGPYSVPNGVGTVAGEHPRGEHPSRTLFVRNINSNVEDTELRSLFEQYGAIRKLYTACKHRGFVIISYYDIRDARNAMRALQNKPLRRRKLDIHFSIPKENPSDKDMNQGTLVIFNLDPSVSNDTLRHIFGAFGEVKEIRETPHKRHHKFIEFYDVRAAEAALHSLNRSDIAGKRIKLEPSRPGGVRRNLMQQWNLDVDQDEMRSFRHQVGSPVTNSPPGTWAQFSSPRDNGTLRALDQSPILGGFSPMASNHLSGLASILNPSIPDSLKIPPIGRDQNRANINSNSMHMYSQSFPEQNSEMMLNIGSSPGTRSSIGPSDSGGSIGRLTGPQFLWGCSTPYSECSSTRSSMGPSVTSNGHIQGLPYPSRHNAFSGAPDHHIGSAPAGIPFERHRGYFQVLQNTSFPSQVGFGSTGVGRNNGSVLLNMGPSVPMSHGGSLSGSISDNLVPSFGMITSQTMGQMFFGSPPYLGQGTNGHEGLTERGRNRRVDNNISQYQLDLEKIVSGKDNRTTLMIKNIPNKYTSKMLLATIDENHKGAYNFFYLPIDFKNKCNMGYAFINMVSPLYITPFYQTFNGKKWEKFNSEKVASLAYARIQGKEALVIHFQNSSLMNEDKRCRPILFHCEGAEASGNQELFLQNGVNIHVRPEDGPPSGDSPESQTQSNQGEMLDTSDTPGSGCGEK